MSKYGIDIKEHSNMITARKENPFSLLFNFFLNYDSLSRPCHCQLLMSTMSSNKLKMWILSNDLYISTLSNLLDI